VVARAEFEHITKKLLTRTREIAERVLADAELAWDDLDRVLLAGGSTRMPMVRDMLEVYCIARRDGGVFRRDDDALELIGQENAGDENRGLVRLDEHLIVAGGSGGLWYRDLASGESTIFDLAETDVAGPDLIQSIALDPGRAVYVGGHYGLTEHKPWKVAARRFRVAGEPKAMLPLNGKLIAALYPSSEVIELDPATGAVRSLGKPSCSGPGRSRTTPGAGWSRSRARPAPASSPAA
jgi:hypothetical protein